MKIFYDNDGDKNFRITISKKIFLKGVSIICRAFLIRFVSIDAEIKFKMIKENVHRRSDRVFGSTMSDSDQLESSDEDENVKKELSNEDRANEAEEEEEFEDEEDDEIEPLLTYSRIRGDVPNIIKNESITCMTINEKVS